MTLASSSNGSRANFDVVPGALSSLKREGSVLKTSLIRASVYIADFRCSVEEISKAITVQPTCTWAAGDYGKRTQGNASNSMRATDTDQELVINAWRTAGNRLGVTVEAPYDFVCAGRTHSC